MNKTRDLTLMASLIALSYASLYFIRFPLIPSASFLRVDIKDVFIAIGGLILGPSAAFWCGIIVSVLQMLTVSEYGIIGLIMNILSVSSYVMPIVFVYKRRKTTVSLIYGLIIGCICMTTAMVGWNYLISPLYMGISRESIVSMLIPIFLPFNVAKSVINAITIFTVWKVVANCSNNLDAS